MIAFILISACSLAMDKDSIIHYSLPDSVTAYQFYAEVTVKGFAPKKECYGGIMTDRVKLTLEADRKEKEIVFEFPESAPIVANGIGAETDEKGEISFPYDWNANETYKLMISAASDSAGNFSIYSGYAWLPRENKWKFIGSCKISGSYDLIKFPASIYSTGNSSTMTIETGQVWCQRNSGSWKKLKESGTTTPVVNLYSHIDSLAQRKIDIGIIEKTVTERNNKDGVYYTILREGTGKQVDLHDTVTVYYRVTLLNDTATIDEAKDSPATFPLHRLIKGWQIGVPILKVGGKIRLIIPSDLAYSIRTRSAKIPPNSILAFDIEVIDAKPPSK